MLPNSLPRIWSAAIRDRQAACGGQGTRPVLAQRAQCTCFVHGEVAGPNPDIIITKAAAAAAGGAMAVTCGPERRTIHTRLQWP